ncbi:hypothetical protein [Desulfovibrio gilichinskyi]|uniref:LPP20 lipoprotein n=1 Tax=Desulfovibrio gilichinskyi TaxID=1519643 RepID=A0A1X7C6F8_9BACT|nr:hypothetical protein [Desulfovibrio gilichinskyi]SME90865.1 hypothetical protein SAMN06295933_0410 [Desulfovibrio gilichinskyi]
MRLYSFLAFLFLLLAPHALYAGGISNEQGYVVETSGSSINWGSGLISASAEILPMQDTLDSMRTKAIAVRESGVKARKNLLDSILGLSLSSSETVAQAFNDDIKTATTLRGVVQNSLLRTEDTPDGKVKVTASLNIIGDLASIIIPPTLPFLSGIAPTLSEGRGGEIEQAVTGESGLDAASYSGVVIDARGLNLIPMLLPVIYDGKGVGIYGPFKVSRDSVLKNGLVSYVFDSSLGSFRERVGNFPLIVKPVSTQGTVRGNLILSLDDSIKFRAALKRKSVIDNCAVVIVMDRPESGIREQSVESEGAYDVGTVSAQKKSPVIGSKLQEAPIVDEGSSPALQ